MVQKPRISEKPNNSEHKLQQSVEISNFLAHHDIVVEYLCRILEDCHTLLPLYGKLHLERDRNTIRERFSHEGLSFATKTLPSFFDAVLQHLEYGTSDYPSFKILRGRTYPVFLQQLVAPILEKPYDDVTANYMKCLYQLCVPFKKLKGPYKKSVLDHELAKFKETDKNLPTEEDIVDDVKLSTIVDVASVIIGELFEGFDPFDRTQAHHFLPGPGPGATNTPTLPNERFRPHVDYASITKVFPLKEWYNHTSVAPQMGKFDLRVGKKCLRHRTKKAARPSSRFTFVPKTYDKPRGICIEQLEMQWQQQGIRKAMYHWIENHPRTRGFVNFTNQEINAALALLASVDRMLATIDMSEASDRVPLWLVKRLFARCKPLLNALLACRTEIIEFDKNQGSMFAPWIKANKFAPMGSALCFPVMGIVHYALLRAIILLSPKRQSQKDLDSIWVYGDDLILPSQYVNEVYSILPKFGMKLNKEKSYVKSHFRESCGCHAYNGVDITPTRFKTIVKFPPSYDDLVSALETEAQLYKKRFFGTASFIREQILHFKRFGGQYLPTVTNESSILGWIRDRDALVETDVTKLKKRWNCDLQRQEYKLRYLHQIGEKLAELPDNEAYLRCLLGGIKSQVSITITDKGLRIRETASKEVGEILPKKQLRTGWFPLSSLAPIETINLVEDWLSS